MKREVIHIEPPRRDWRNQPVPDRFLAPVTVEVHPEKWMYFIGEKMFMFFDIKELIETAKKEAQ